MIYGYEILGGALIGLGSALPLLFEGRIAGASAYAASCLHFKQEGAYKAQVFVLGLMGAGFVWKSLVAYWSYSDSVSLLPLGVWACSGLLVGFGARLGGGCTSGHGVCGLGRFSTRSMVAVCAFLAMAFLVRWIVGGIYG